MGGGIGGEEGALKFSMSIQVLRWKNVSLFFSPGAAKSWQASCHRPYQVACSRGWGGFMEVATQGEMIDTEQWRERIVPKIFGAKMF